MDYVDSLGTSFLAHRLRRLSDNLVDQVAANFANAGLKVPARSVSTLHYLGENGPTGPVELGKALKFSHPLMVRSLRNLEDLGLVEAVVDESDQRRRRVQLTRDGEREAARSFAMTTAFSREAIELAAEAGIDLSQFADQLSVLVRLFAEKPVEIAKPVEGAAR
jgi:DNA-binding MarR family transcriptional regulator